MFLLVLLLVIPMVSVSEVGTDNILVSTLIIHSIQSAESPVLNLTYTTLTNLVPNKIISNSLIAGDHILVKAEWTPTVVNRSRLEIDAPAIPAILIQDQDTSTLQIDTRSLGNNATCTIIATAYLTNGSIISETFVNVYIGNFFVPKVRVVSPNGGEDWTGVHNITWTASDYNVGDSLQFEVSISSDSGSSFEVLASSITRKWFEWNCTSFDKLDTYLVRVRVTDGIYFSSDKSDSTFTAGEVSHSTTTTTTTTTTTSTTTTTGSNTSTTTTNFLEPRVVIFVVILLASSCIMALVVYYASRKWF